jgi:hypothetical protein
MKIKANSIEDAREMLLKRGIFAFQKTAGYVPPRAEKFDDLPTFKEGNLNSRREFRINTWLSYSMIFVSVIKCHEPLCRKCSKALNNYLGSTIALYFYFDNEERCCCCGDMIEDEFQF